MTIVVHASDCKAIQCRPIDKQSALIVAIRPAQRNMTVRLTTCLFDVNHRSNAGRHWSRADSCARRNWDLNDLSEQKREEEADDV